MGRSITKFEDSVDQTETIIVVGDIVNDCPIKEIWVSSVGTPLFTIDGVHYNWQQLHEMLPEGRPIAPFDEQIRMSEEAYKIVTSGL